LISFILANTDHGAMLVNRMDYNESFNGNFYGVGAQLMEKGSYDPSEVETLKSLLAVRRGHFGNDVVMLDAGANIGVHTVECARYMKDWGSVIAVEAQERIFYALAGNITLQNTKNARAIWAALDDKNGEISIPLPDYTKPGSFGSFELKQRFGNENIGQDIDYSKPVSTVATVAIDSWDLPRLDLLKMDIEGMEIEALQGAAETLKRCRPIIHVECIKVNVDGLKSLLNGLGYNFMRAGMNAIAVHESDPSRENIAVEKKAA